MWPTQHQASCRLVSQKTALDGVSQVVLAAVAAEAVHGVFQVAMAADGRRFPVQEAAAFCQQIAGSCSPVQFVLFGDVL